MNLRSLDYARQMSAFVTIAVGGWIGFLLAFQHYFPDDYDPTSSRSVLWAWMIGGTIAFVGILFGTFALFRTPREWWSSGAIAGIAPAMILDAIATTFYGDWFSSAGPHESSAYSATILLGAGTMLLMAFALGKPTRR